MTTTLTAPLKMTERTNLHGYTYEAVEFDGVLISFRDKDTDRRGYEAKARVFGAVDALVADLNEIEPKYILRTDEDSTDVERVQEKIWLAWRDTTKKIAAQRLSVLLQRLVEADIEDVSFSDDLLDKVTFSFKAGCSCGCSPGFVLNGRVRSGVWNSDISLTTLSDGIEKVEDEG